MDSQLKTIVTRLDAMIKAKEKDVQILETNQPPNQRMIEITQGELLGMRKVWKIVEDVVMHKR